MREINCNIVKDILPLYVDDVVCEDTRKMVEGHLQNCESCRGEAEALGKKLILPLEQREQKKDAEVLRGFKRKWRNKKVLITLISLTVCFIVCFGLFNWMNTYEIYIPYDPVKISVTTSATGEVVAHYSGDTFAGARTYGNDGTSAAMGADPETGEKRVLVYFYYYDTVWSRYIEPLFSKKDQKEDTFILGYEKNFDDVIYGEYESMRMDSETPKEREPKKIWSIDKTDEKSYN